MVAYGLGLPWLWLLFGPFAIALWSILAAFTAAFAWMQSRAEAREWTAWRMVGFTLVNWCGWEFIRAELFPLKFPWMTPGLAMGPNRLLPWIGVYGAGVVVIWTATCLAQKRWLGAVAGMVVAWAITTNFYWGATLAISSAPEAIQVAALQYEDVGLQHYLDATKKLPSEIKYVVWPEYAVPYDVRANKGEWASLQALCREKGITLTLGTQTKLKDTNGWLNTALTLDASGVLGEHYKVHPVHFFDDGTPGKTAFPVTTSWGKIGTPICFDCDYEGVVRRMTAAGAEAFIVPMMDEKSWSKRQHIQHAELFRIRACENGRWFMVCGTSGVSQVIDPCGGVSQRLGAMEQGVLWGHVVRSSQLTPYTRWGWLTPWCLLGMAGVCWIVLLLPRRTAKETVP
jgi:apolipoprotein N-acyltransferase